MLDKKPIKASTHYAEWRGTAQADNNDFQSLGKYLQEKGWINGSDSVVAWHFFAGEHTNFKPAEDLRVNAYIAPSAEIGKARQENRSLAVEQINFDIPVLEFFNLFKRISVAVSSDGDFKELVIRSEEYK